MTLWEFRFLENLASAWSPVVQNLSLLSVCIHILYFSRKATNNNTNVKVTQLKACWPRWATRFYIWNKCLCYALSVDSRTKVKRKDLFSLHGTPGLVSVTGQKVSAGVVWFLFLVDQLVFCPGLGQMIHQKHGMCLSIHNRVFPGAMHLWCVVGEFSWSQRCHWFCRPQASWLLTVKNPGTQAAALSVLGWVGNYSSQRNSGPMAVWKKGSKSEMTVKEKWYTWDQGRTSNITLVQKQLGLKQKCQHQTPVCVLSILFLRWKTVLLLVMISKGVCCDKW